MRFLSYIKYFDGSFRTITNEQASELKKHQMNNVKYVALPDSQITVSNISRIESTRFLLAEMDESVFSRFGRKLTDIQCMKLGLLPLTEEFLEECLAEIRDSLAKKTNDLAVLEEKIAAHEESKIPENERLEPLAAKLRDKQKVESEIAELKNILAMYDENLKKPPVSDKKKTPKS